ncbi:MAG: hypothetical protein ACRD0Y_10100 [Terriglobales bacterium]
MTDTQKITLEVPRELLKQAQRATGKGISETVRAGLRSVAASDAYKRLAQSRGKWKLGISWQELKDDR